MTEPRQPRPDDKLRKTQEVSEGEILGPRILRPNFRHDEHATIPTRERVEQVSQQDRRIGMIRGSFRLNPETDKVVAAAIANDPMEPGEAILPYLPEALLRKSSVIRFFSALFEHPVELWAPGVKLKSILLRKPNGVNDLAGIGRTNLELMQRAGIPEKGQPPAMLPFVRLTHFPSAGSKTNTNRLLSLKASFFWKNEEVEAEEAEYLLHRLVQAFALSSSFEETMECLFPDLLVGDFFKKRGEKEPVYGMFLEKLLQIKRHVSGRKLAFVDMLERSMRNQTPEAFVSKSIRHDQTQAFYSPYDIVKANANVSYEEYAKDRFDREFIYQGREMREWGRMHDPPRVGILEQDMERIAWQMPDWVAYVRELTFKMLNAMIRSFVSGDVETMTRSLQELESLENLLREYSLLRKFRLALPDVEPYTGKPQLTGYTHPDLKKR